MTYAELVATLDECRSTMRRMEAAAAQNHLLIAHAAAWDLEMTFAYLRGFYEVIHPAWEDGCPEPTSPSPSTPTTTAPGASENTSPSYQTDRYSADTATSPDCLTNSQKPAQTG